MSKNLIDKGKTFEIYFSLGTSRSLSKLHKQLAKKHPKSSPSYATLKNWAKASDWKNAAEVRDTAVDQKVNEKVIPAWAEVKVELVEAFITQIKDAMKAKISPESSKDMVAVSKELRALLGEPDKHDHTTMLTVRYENDKNDDE